MWNSPANTENRAKLHRYPPKLTGILSQEAKPRGTKYRSISVILHEAAPNVISRDNKQGKHPKWNIPHIPRAGKGRLRPQAQGMCGIFHEGCFPSLLSQGNGVILRGFLYLLVYLTCICRIDDKLVTLKKPKLKPRNRGQDIKSFWSLSWNSKKIKTAHEKLWI